MVMFGLLRLNVGLRECCGIRLPVFVIFNGNPVAISCVECMKICSFCESKTTDVCCGIFLDYWFLSSIERQP